MKVKCIKDLELQGKLFTIKFFKDEEYDMIIKNNGEYIVLGFWEFNLYDYKDYFKPIKENNYMAAMLKKYGRGVK